MISKWVVIVIVVAVKIITGIVIIVVVVIVVVGVEIGSDVIRVRVLITVDDVIVVDVILDEISVTIHRPAMKMMLMMMMAMPVMQDVGGQHRMFALPSAPGTGAAAVVESDALSAVETRQMPAGGADAELARGTEKAGVAGASAGVDASAVAVASVGASGGRASVAGPPDRAEAFVRGDAAASPAAAAAGAHRRQALGAGVAFGAPAAVVADAPAAVEAGRGADGPAVGSGVVAEGTGAMTRASASPAVEAGRITDEVLALPTRVAVGANAADGFIPAETAVEAEERTARRRRKPGLPMIRLLRRHGRRRGRFYRTRTGVAFFGLPRRRPSLLSDPAVALFDRDRRVRAKGFAHAPPASARRRARAP